MNLFSFGRKVRSLFTALLLVFIHMTSLADPTCPCDDEFDPSIDPVGYFECVEDKCSGINVPITKDMWVLVLMGIGLSCFRMTLLDRREAH